jgi:hypothetical protein
VIQDDVLDTFKNLFLKTLNMNAPYKKKQVKHQNQAHWFNEDIATSIHKKNYAKKKILKTSNTRNHKLKN